MLIVYLCVYLLISYFLLYFVMLSSICKQLFVIGRETYYCFMFNKELQLVIKLEMDCAVFKSGVFSNKIWTKIFLFYLLSLIMCESVGKHNC